MQRRWAPWAGLLLAVLLGAAGGRAGAGTTDLVGSVLDVDGRPVAGATVRLWPMGTAIGPHDPGPAERAGIRALFEAPVQPAGALVTRTDGAGRYRLTGVPVSEVHEIEAFDPDGTRSGWTTHFTSIMTATQVDPITVRPTRRVTGRLRDTLGNPVAAFVSTYPHGVRAPWPSRPAWRVRPISRSVPTDAQGRFVLRAPTDTDARIEIFVPGAGRRNDHLLGRDETDVELRWETTGPALVRGRVLDEGGAPVADALVVAHVTDARTAISRAAGPEGAVSGNPALGILLPRPRILLARTTADGRYELGPAFPGAIVRMAVAADGLRLADLGPTDIPVSAEHPWQADFRLTRGRTLHGRVRAADGTPVAGASVSVQTDGVRVPYARPVETRTDAEGAYLLQGVPLTEARLLVARAGYYWTPDDAPGTRSLATWGAQLPAGSAGETLERDLTLQPGREVVARLVDDDGKPAAGVRAGLVLMGAKALPYSNLQRTATSDAEGNLVFEGLPPLVAGTATIYISVIGYGRVSSAVDPGASSQANPVLIQVTRGASVRGRVVDGDGHPVAGVPVGTLEGTMRPQTDAEGRFELLGVPAGKRQVYVENARRSPGTVVDVTRDAPGEDVELQIAWRGVVRGTVVDADGDPVPGVPMVVVPTVQAWDSKPLTTDAHGAFVVSHMPAGAYRVQVLAGSRPSAEVATDGEPLRLVLTDVEPTILEGQCVDAAGAPVPGGTIRISAASGSAPFPPIAARVNDGRFRVALPGDCKRLQVQLDPPRGYLAKTLADVALTGGPLRIQLEPAKSITGTVVDLEGKPVAGYALVAGPMYARRDRRIPVQAVTDAHGRFAFTGLTEHTYVITGQEGQDWSRPPPLMTQSGATGLRLEVGRYMRVFGRVQTRAGDPVQGATVRVQIQPSQPGASVATSTQAGERVLFLVEADEAGRFEVERFPPGFELKITGRPPEARNRDLLPVVVDHFTPDAEELVLTLPDALGISGRVTDEQGRPIHRAFVRTWGAKLLDGSRPPRRPIVKLYQHALTDEDGRYELRPFPPGIKFGVSAEGPKGEPGKWFRAMKKDVETGSSGVKFVLEAGRTVTGVVEGLSAEALKGAKIIAYVDKVQVSGFTFDGSTNEFVIGHLRAGRVRLGFRPQKRDPDLSYPPGVEVDVPARDVRLVVTRAYELRVRILAADPTPSRIRFYDAEGRRHDPDQVIDGHTFLFRSLRDEPGMLHVVLRKDKAVALLEGVRPSVGRIEVEPHPALRIRGRIDGLPGKLRRGDVMAVRGPIKIAGRLSEDGWFEVDGLPQGEWHLQFHLTDPAGTVAEAPVRAKAGDEEILLTWK